MECAPHRIWKKLMALVLSLVLMAVMLPGALAVDLNVDAGFYFKQSRGGTCTLASAAMMLRRRAFLDGLTDWTDVTENSVRGSAWAGGLSHSFNYNAMQVGYSTLPSNNEEKKAVLIQLLAEHPEGIVLYDRTHREALFYRPRRWAIVPLEAFHAAAPGREERDFRRLWRRFYDTIAIEGRENPRCRMTQMPKRFWGTMTEFQNEPEERKELAP